MDKVLFTKDNIDNLLFQLAKEYKKINRKNGGIKRGLFEKDYENDVDYFLV